MPDNPEVSPSSRVFRRKRVSPIEGVRAILGGITLSLNEPKIRRRFFGGVLVNGVVFLLMMVVVIWAAFALTAGLVDDTWAIAALGWLARIAIIVGFVLIGPVVFAIVGDIILPIFHGRIFETAREWANGPPLPDVPSGIAVEVRSIGVDLRRLAKFLGLSVLLLLMNLLPVIGNLAYLVLQFGLVAHTMGWDLLAYHFEAHGVRLADQRRFINGNLPLVLAIGAVGELLCLIPFANLIFITTNVAGAGILSAKLDLAAGDEAMLGETRG